MSARYFEDLDVWKLSRALTKKVYETTRTRLFSKDFSLSDQLRRSSVSIMSNIAEGFERGGNKEFIQYLYYAKGSSGELRSQLYVAFDQNYINESLLNEISELSKIVSVKLSNFIQALKKSTLKGSKFKQF